MELAQIGPFAAVPIILAIVAVATRLGMPSKYAPVLNMALSTVWYVLAAAVIANPELLLPTTAVLNILATVLMTWGTYEGVMWTGRRLTPA